VLLPPEIKWNVEFGSLTLELLIASIANELRVLSKQLPTMWFFDKRLHKDDRQLLDVFEMYKEEMGCQLVVGCLTTPTSSLTFPNEPSSAALENLEIDVDLHPEEEHANNVESEREPDIFDNHEEYVGVDDEHIYTKIPATNALPTNISQPTNNDSGDVDNSANTNDDPFYVEAEVDDAYPLEVHVIHDPENPNIVKGALFPDIITFRKAIRHHAVKIGFEFGGLKTDKGRFSARCAADGCPWRIHASTIYDKKTIQVNLVAHIPSQL
jgi:hypothetical protein